MRKDLYRTLDDPFHTQEMELIHDSDSWHCWLITDEKEDIMGFVELSARNIVDGCLSSPVAYLEGLYLKPEHRGKGFGKAILRRLVKWCVAQGFSELATDTEIANTKAQRFYESVGFEVVDRVVEYRLELNKP